MIKKNSSSKRSEDWSRIQEYGTYAGYKTLLYVYKLAGVFALRIIVYPVVVFYFLFNVNARKSSQEYLQTLHQFMGKQSPWKDTPGLWKSLQHFMSFGQATVDKVTVWLGSYKKEDLTFFGYETFSSLKKNRKGVLIIISHLGNVDVCRGVSADSKGGPFIILEHNAHAPNFQRILSEVTGVRENIEIIEVQNITPDIAIKLQEKIEDGGTIVIAGDRTPVESQSRVNVCSFLGKDAAFAQGPFILASLLDCPVFLLFGMKYQNSYHVFFEHFSDSLKIKKTKRVENLNKNMKRYVSRLEQYTCRYPLQWYNFYNYWASTDSQNNDH